MKNNLKIFESLTFLAVMLLILFGFTISNCKLIATYERIVGHSLNEFTIKIMLLFKVIVLVLGLLLLLATVYIKYKKIKLKLRDKNNIFVGLLFPAGIFLLIQLFFFTEPFLDDAFISFRYAENLFEKGKLAFNTHEPPVEGYTHPLWLLLLLIPQLFGINLLLFTKIVGLVFTVIGLVFVYFISNKNSIASWLYVLSASVAGWSMTGLETPLYTALSLIFIYLFLKEKYVISSFILFLVTLTRPEGIVLLFPAFFTLLKYDNRPYRTVTQFSAVFFMLYIPYILWKYAYFGDLLPNTFYAKHAFLVGIPYITGFLFSKLYLILPVVCCAAYKKFFKKSPQYDVKYVLQEKELIFITLAILLSILSYLNIDHHSGFYDRFFQLPLVLLFIVSSEHIRSIMRELLLFANKKNIQFFTFCLILLFFIGHMWYLPEAIVYFNIHYDGLEKAHLAAAKFLNQQYQGEYTVALSDIGVFSYYSNFDILDIQGLTDKVLSRGFNATYVLERNPEIIILDSSSTSEFIQSEELYSANWEDLVLYNDPRFHNKYVFLNKTFQHTPPIVLWVFKRKDLN